jgi:hypothetical protein
MRNPSSVSLLLLSVAAGAAAAPGPAQPTTEEIVARYVAARGGLEKIRAIRSVIYRGVYREGAQVSDHATLSLMRPYLKLVGDARHPSRDFAEGYDGSAWELYGNPGVVIRTVGAAAAAGRHAVSIGGPLVDSGQRGWTLTLGGEDAIGGRRAYRLEIRMPDGFVQQELVDAETWLLIGERKTAKVHAFGAQVPSEELIGDYRPVGGVLFPYSRREVERASGRVLDEMQWTSISLNEDLDPAAFSPPELRRTPLQAFLEGLYAERADVDAVLWSYRDFRRAHPAVDTCAGVGFIGYQMLKMGDVRSAVALLERNAEDHPASATAAFGLGRAYASAGERARARLELERALTLDPRLQTARKALEAMR